MNIVKVISSTIKNGRHIIKVLRKGLKDVQTAHQVAPYGLDSNPIKDMVAIYGTTSQDGQTVIIGYINLNQVAEPGEYRTFCTDANGNQKFYTWMKKNGTMEIGGDKNHMTRFEELEKGFNELRGDFNTHVQNYNGHTNGVIPSGGGPTSFPTPLSQPSTANISQAKITEIKTL